MAIARHLLRHRPLRPLPKEKVGEGLVEEEAPTLRTSHATSATLLYKILRPEAGVVLPRLALQEAEVDARLGLRPSRPSPFSRLVEIRQNGPLGEIARLVADLPRLVTLLTIVV